MSFHIGDVVLKPAWGKDQPNNYNGEQNCVVLDGGRNWLWNDVGCNLDYLHYICQHGINHEQMRRISKKKKTSKIPYYSTEPLSCGSPDSNQNTTVSGNRRNHTIGGQIEYSCPKGHALVGNAIRKCEKSGVWSNIAPTCKCMTRF